MPRSSHLVRVTLAALPFLAACIFHLQRSLTAGEIIGKAVYASADGTLVPAANAVVTIEDSTISVTADGQGTFAVTGLPVGTFNLTIVASPSSEATQVGLRLSGLNIVADDGLDLGQVQLASLGAIQGQVTLDNSPIGNGAVAVLPGMAEVAVMNGAFSFPSLLPGTYAVAVFYPGATGSLISSPAAVQVSPGSTAQTTINLSSQSDSTSAGAVQGVVQVAGTTDNSGVDVQFSAQGPDLTTSANGNYASGSVPAGIYIVTASLGGFASVTVSSVLVGSGTAVVPTITLVASATPDAGVPACLVDTECPAGEVCIARVCAAPPDGGADAGIAGLTDAGPGDAGPVDAGPADAGFIDAGAIDAGLSDGGVEDAGTADAGTSATPPDAGAPADAGIVGDAGASADAGTMDDAGTFMDAGP
jgi:hypothetical protein